MANSEYNFYKGMLKGDYVKGANALEGVLRNQSQALEMTLNDGAMSVIFEKMTYGGRWWLPDIFFRGMFSVGNGLRTYVRTIEPNFDSANTLGTLNTIQEISANQAAMTVIQASPTARNAFDQSQVAMSALALDPIGMAVVAASLPMMQMIEKNQYFMDRIVESEVAMNQIKQAPVAMGVIVASQPFMNSTERTLIARTALASHQVSIDNITESNLAMNTINVSAQYRTSMVTSDLAITAITLSLNAMNIVSTSDNFIASIAGVNNAINRVLESQIAMTRINANLNAARGGSIANTPHFILNTAASQFFMDLLADNNVFLNACELVPNARTQLGSSVNAMTYLRARAIPTTKIASSNPYIQTFRGIANARNHMVNSTMMMDKVMATMEAQIVQWESLPPDGSGDPPYYRPPFTEIAVFYYELITRDNTFLFLMYNHVESINPLLSESKGITNRAWAHAIGHIQTDTTRRDTLINSDVSWPVFYASERNMNNFNAVADWYLLLNVDNAMMNRIVDTFSMQAIPRRSIFWPYKANIWNTMTANRQTMDRALNQANSLNLIKEMLLVFYEVDTSATTTGNTAITRFEGQVPSREAMRDCPHAVRKMDIPVQATTRTRLSDHFPGDQRVYAVVAVRDSVATGTQTYTMSFLANNRNGAANAATFTRANILNTDFIRTAGMFLANVGILYSAVAAATNSMQMIVVDTGYDKPL